MNDPNQSSSSSSSPPFRFVNLRGNTLLARGTFGEVHMALRVWDVTHDESEQPGGGGSSYAVLKTITGAWTDSRGTTLKSDVANEVLALRLLTSSSTTSFPHPNIVPLWGVFPTSSSSNGFASSTSITLAFPYCPMDLYQIWTRRRNSSSLSLSEMEVEVEVEVDDDGLWRTVWKDLLAGLDHCHRHGVVHRDVKPNNCLLSRDGRMQLGDFGAARPVGCSCASFEEKHETVVGALSYRPPEILLGDHTAREAGDVFSLGVTMAECLTLGRCSLWSMLQNEHGHGHAHNNDRRSPQPSSSVFEQLSRTFDLLGTPTEERWPEAAQTPDYAKFQTTPREPQRLSQVIPLPIHRLGGRDDNPNGENQKTTTTAAATATTTSFLLLEELLTSLLALDPSVRPSAGSCLQHEWLWLRKGWDRPKILKELVPLSWREPPVSLHEDDDDDDTFISQWSLAEQALRTVQTRQHDMTLWEGGPWGTGTLADASDPADIHETNGEFPFVRAVESHEEECLDLFFT